MSLGELSAIGSAFLWALNGVLLKPLTARVPALRITSLLYLVAAVFIIAIALPLGKAAEASHIPWLQLVGLLLAGCIGMGVGDTSYVQSLASLGVSKAFPISTAGYILLVFLLAAVLLSEQMTLTGLAGAVVLLTGIWLIVRSTSNEQVTPARSGSLRQGLMFAGLAAICWAVTTTILKLAPVDIDVLAANVFRVPMVALLLTSVNLRLYGWDFKVYDRRTVGIILLAGITGIAASSMLFLYAIQEAGAAKTAVLSSTSPLFAAGMSLAFLGERMTASVAAGTLLSVVGVWLVM